MKLPGAASLETDQWVSEGGWAVPANVEGLLGGQNVLHRDIVVAKGYAPYKMPLNRAL